LIIDDLLLIIERPGDLSALVVGGAFGGSGTFVNWKRWSHGYEDRTN